MTKSQNAIIAGAAGVVIGAAAALVSQLVQSRRQKKPLKVLITGAAGPPVCKPYFTDVLSLRLSGFYLVSVADPRRCVFLLQDKSATRCAPWCGLVM